MAVIDAVVGDDPEVRRERLELLEPRFRARTHAVQQDEPLVASALVVATATMADARVLSVTARPVEGAANREAPAVSNLGSVLARCGLAARRGELWGDS